MLIVVVTLAWFVGLLLTGVAVARFAVPARAAPGVRIGSG